VHNNGSWPASWGDRPGGRDDLERGARAHLAGVPRLVAVFSHRYLASDPQLEPSPVFSVHQTASSSRTTTSSTSRPRVRVPPLHPSDQTHEPFWSDLSEGAENPRSVRTAHRQMSVTGHRQMRAIQVVHVGVVCLRPSYRPFSGTRPGARH
jgi:hypothetical protein